MSPPPVLTGNLAEDWKNLCALWLELSRVLMAEVGPKWDMPPQHLACMLFADAYPNSKEFLVERLGEPDPLVAAYAFKCLIRVSDLRIADLPAAVFEREDPIEVHNHSRVKATTLGKFIAEYFDLYGDRGDLLESQQQCLGFQQRVLLPYYEALARADRLN